MFIGTASELAVFCNVEKYVCCEIDDFVKTHLCMSCV